MWWSERANATRRIGRVTQLIALTGSEGTWRKSLIDKAVACVSYLSSMIPC